MRELQVLDEIRDYVCGESTQPLILFGDSGCGKTSILAKAYSQVYTVFFCHCYMSLFTEFSYL